MFLSLNMYLSTRNYLETMLPPRVKLCQRGDPIAFTQDMKVEFNSLYMGTAVVRSGLRH